MTQIEYLRSCWIRCHKIFSRCSWFPEDEGIDFEKVFLWHQFKTVSELARLLRFKSEFSQMSLEKLLS